MHIYEIMPRDFHEIHEVPSIPLGQSTGQARKLFLHHYSHLHFNQLAILLHHRIKRRMVKNRIL